MAARRFFWVIIFLAAQASAQPLRSPAEFLGYGPGEKFTAHARIIEYFRYAAAAMPSRMKLEDYGTSQEGRPLVVAILSSQENMNALGSIRENQIALVTGNKGRPDGPVVVWLSYNVHGNEASSAEVSMKVLYDLLTSSSADIKRWLSNTVVIIDPCLNPDGRDRYVNWYNGIAGNEPNPDPAAAEHDEPWPSGRGNHYYFDLNRDWAWQTQAESRARIKKYREWMPAIHVDFHEQYPGSPYYFAPAAEPFHEVITPWQRSFQTEIGKNNAKYFDANGWLYFTREYFDLFYPAYGDTYPIYNGSIGMTYEQAGHGVAGLAVKTEYDTLTLSQRILHHYTSSLSTIEAASVHAAKINEEFRKYFEEGRSKGIGPYAGYVVSGASSKKTKPLLDLFIANGITWSYAKENLGAKGFNYFTGKEEAFRTAPGDLFISSRQPGSALLKVLFEPQSRLADSSTYDITAWALPYAYGLQSWALKENIVTVSETPVSDRPAFSWNQSYGYLLPYEALADAKILASLLKQGVKVRFSEKAFTYNGKKYAPGTLLILKSGNENHLRSIEKIIGVNGVIPEPVSSGFMESGVDFGSDKIHMVKKARVAAFTGKLSNPYAAGEVWHFFDQQLDYPLTLINAADPSGLDLRNYDVVIIPNGDYSFLADKDASVSLKNWVKQGGKLIVMEGAVSNMASGDWGIKKKKESEPEGEGANYANLKKYGNRDRDGIVNNIPGAIYKTELDNTHPLAFGYPDFYFSLKQNADLYEFSKSGWNVGVIKKDRQVSGFVGSAAREKLQDGTVIGVQSMGSGQVIYFADDPLFRSFWENGKLMFFNAVFLTGG